MIRITAGRLKGRRLETAASLQVRPTAVRARQAVFNILAHGREFRGPHGPLPLGVSVLDVFAGSGALGFEALSRGAAEVVFIEKARDLAALIKLNGERLKETSRVTVMAMDACRLGPAPRTSLLAFLDPPYGEGLAGPALQSLALGGWLAPGAVAVVEIGAAEELALPEGFSEISERRYGAAKLKFLRYAGG